MSESKHALALHVVGGNEPILVAISDNAADDLVTTLARRLQAGDVETIEAANGASFVVNFAHVVAAHVDVAPPLGQLYGSVKRA